MNMENDKTQVMTLGQLAEAFGGDTPVYFKVYSCGQSSAHELLERDVEMIDGKLYILSDLN